MSTILDLIGQQLDAGTVQSLAGRIGATPEQTATAVHAALPALLGALHGNASTASGAGALLGALDRDHDGSILDDLAGFFGQGPSAADARGAAHILGDRQGNVADAVAQHSGLDRQQVMQLLAMLAPVVLGALARARQQHGASADYAPSPGAPAGAPVPAGGGLGDLLGAALGRLQQGGGGLGGVLGGLLGGSGSSIVTDMLTRGLGGQAPAAPAGAAAGGPAAGDGGLAGEIGSVLGGLLGGKR